MGKSKTVLTHGFIYKYKTGYLNLSMISTHGSRDMYQLTITDDLHYATMFGIHNCLSDVVSSRRGKMTYMFRTEEEEITFFTTDWRKESIKVEMQKTVRFLDNSKGK